MYLLTIKIHNSMDRSKKEMDKDMSFLREYFHIPHQIETRWVFIHDNQQERLGLELIDHSKVIDVADACFRQSCEKLNLIPVSHMLHEKSEEFVTDDGDRLWLPKHYVRKLYFRRIFSEELLATPLL